MEALNSFATKGSNRGLIHTNWCDDLTAIYFVRSNGSYTHTNIFSKGVIVLIWHHRNAPEDLRLDPHENPLRRKMLASSRRRPLGTAIQPLTINHNLQPALCNLHYATCIMQPADYTSRFNTVTGDYIFSHVGAFSEESMLALFRMPKPSFVMKNEVCSC